jgi:hypothetical protein
MTPEKENTFRALKDEPLLMTSVFCRFGIHKWTKYREPYKTGFKYFTRSNPAGYYTVMVQPRSCVDCNQENHRTFYLYERD